MESTTYVSLGMREVRHLHDASRGSRRMCIWCVRRCPRGSPCRHMAGVCGVDAWSPNRRHRHRGIVTLCRMACEVGMDMPWCGARVGRRVGRPHADGNRTCGRGPASPSGRLRGAA